MDCSDPSKEERKKSVEERKKSMALVSLLRDSVLSKEQREEFLSLLRDSVLSKEQRKEFLSLLGDCRSLLYSVLPAVIIAALIWCSAGELMLPGSELCLSLLFCNFFCICVYSNSAPELARFFTSITYVALLSFFVGRVVSSVLGMLFLYLDSLLAAFFLGIILTQQSNSTVGNTLSLYNAPRCLWLATPTVLVLHTIINSDVVVGAVIWFCLTFYYIFLGSRLGLEVIRTLRRLRAAAFKAFLAYRLRFHAYFDPEIMKLMGYLLRHKRIRMFEEPDMMQVRDIMMHERIRVLEEPDMMQVRDIMMHERIRMFEEPDMMQVRDIMGYLLGHERIRVLEEPDMMQVLWFWEQLPFTARGDRRSLLVFSLVLAVSVITLLCFSSSEPVLATRTFSLIIISHLFCWALYFSTEATPLSKIFLFLSFTWLVGFLVGALLSDLWGMIIMLLDTFLAAGVFGATLAQHRQIKGTETSSIVALANTPNTRIHKENRRPAYLLIGLLAFCYAPRLVYLIVVDSPAFEVAVSLFGGITFIQIIHISCVTRWLRVIFDSSVPIFLYFGVVVWAFVLSYVLLGELFGLIVYWLFILASTAFLGYYSRVYASYEEEILSRRALANADKLPTEEDDGAATAAGDEEGVNCEDDDPAYQQGDKEEKLQLAAI